MPHENRGQAARNASFSIEIKSTGRPGAYVDYFIDGAAYQIGGGERRKLDVRLGATIAYDRGGDLGPQRYSLSAGVYEFRPSESGLALYKLRLTH